MEFQSKKFAFEKCDVVAQIWDTAGQERFASMTRAYYRNAVAAILVYDVCNRDSLVRLETVWMPELKEFGNNLRCILGRLCGFDVSLWTNCVLAVGNKCDKTTSRDVSVEEGISFAERLNLDFIECSALTKDNVEKMFRRITLSVAKELSDVKQNLEIADLPEGWLAVMPETKPELTHQSSGEMTNPSPGSSLEAMKTVGGSGSASGSAGKISALHASPGSSLEAAKSAGKSNSYEKSLGMLSESPDAFRPIGIDGAASKQRRTSLKREANSTPVNKALLAPKVKYINFWTGEECEDLPTAPADPGLLYTHKPPPPPAPVTTPSPDRRPSNHKTLSNNSVNNAFE